MMSKELNLIQQLDGLIRIKGTGSPKELSRRLNISERTLYRRIDMLKSLGAPIKYCDKRGTYYYEVIGNFRIEFIERLG